MSSPSPTPDPSEDRLARQSDVTVSTNITLYAEYKGFFVYVLTSITLAIWATWSLVPDSVLHSYGVYYHPDKYWSLALPAYFLMAMLFTYIAHVLYNTEIMTLPLDDVRNFVDENAVLAGCTYKTGVPVYKGESASDEAEDWAFRYSSAVWDLPISLTNEVLYADE
jgi:phosphatidylinositol glycan class P protein